MSDDVPIRTSLLRVPVVRDDPDRALRAGREAWQRRGLLAIDPDQVERRHGWAAAQQARNLGELLLGKRKG